MKTTISDVFTDKLGNHATILLPGEGERVSAGGGSCTFKVTSSMSQGQLGIYEIVLPPQTVGARLHYHRFMDEVFIVTKGTLTVDLSNQQHHLGEGSVVYIPRFTPHGFSNKSESETILNIVFNPAEQREGYFKGLFELLNAGEMDVQRFLQLSQKYDTCPAEMGL